MTFLIKGYKSGFKIAAVATRSETVVQLKAEGKTLLDLSNSLFHTWGEPAYPIDIVGDISAIADYDVIEVNEKGVAFVVYSDSSNSNALFITGKCNSNCIMCPNSETLRRTSITHSMSYLTKVIRYIPSDAPNLTITGGEPFLLADGFFVLMEELNACLPHTRFLLLTNGRALANRAFAHAFSTHATDAWRVGIPLHASTAEQHDRISQSAGSFEQTLAGLSFIAAASCEIEIRVVVNRQNYKELEPLAGLLTSEVPRITKVNFIGLEMLGSALTHADEVWVDYRESFQYIRPALDFLIENGIDVGLYNFPLCAVEQPYWGLCERSISDYKIQYEPACENCSVRMACGGIFSSTKRFGHFQVCPM